MRTPYRISHLLAAACLAACLVGGMSASGQEEKWGYRTKEADWNWVDKLEYRASADQYHFTKGTFGGELARASVVDLSVPRPADFDKYAAQIKDTADPSAIAAMEEIVRRYSMLKWDVEGLKLLVPIYLKKREFDKVYSSGDNIRKTGASLPPELLSAYWESLNAKNMPEKLKQEIKDAIESGPRQSAAVAYVARGDLLQKDRKKQEAVVQYLRTIICFGDVRAIQPEALFKLTKLLKELNDPRAEKMKRKLLDEYPDSIYLKDI